MTLGELTAFVRTAHADVWEVEGRLREPYGGGWARVRGARLMASGIPQAKWNNADITAADVDLDAVSAWYEGRDVPWGLRVPLGLDVALGWPLFVKRCVGIRAEAFVPREPPPGSAAGARGRARPRGGTRRTLRWRPRRVARLGDAAARLTRLSALDRGDARGPAAYLTGVGAVDPAVLDALVATAVAAAFADGARLVHANPDDDTEAARLASLGGIEVPGFEVRIVRER